MTEARAWLIMSTAANHAERPMRAIAVLAFAYTVKPVRMQSRDSTEDIESLFTRPLAILPDAVHSHSERRFRAIGRTEEGRGVFMAFTLRRKGDAALIRPISARYMHKEEIESYEKENPGL